MGFLSMGLATVPTLENIEKVAKALGLKLSDFFSDF